MIARDGLEVVLNQEINDLIGSRSIADNIADAIKGVALLKV